MPRQVWPSDRHACAIASIDSPPSLQVERHLKVAAKLRLGHNVVGRWPSERLLHRELAQEAATQRRSAITFAP